MTKPVLTRVRIALAMGFAFVCGWVDTVCVVRYKSFSTMMTGNMFWMGYTIIYPKFQGKHHFIPDPIFYLVVICCYCLGIVLYRLAELKLPHTGRMLGPTLAVIVMVVEFACNIHLKKGSEEPRIIVFLLAIVFGVQNMITLRDGLQLSTSVITGHVNKLGAFTVEACRGKATIEDAKKQSVPVFVMLALISGSFTSAVWDKFCGQSMALLPIAPMLMVLFLLHDFVFCEKTPQKEEDKEEQEQKVDLENADSVCANEKRRGPCTPLDAETGSEIADADMDFEAMERGLSNGIQIDGPSEESLDNGSSDDDSNRKEARSSE